MAIDQKRPWTFVPLLYLMQAIPVTIVQEVSSIVYKDLGVHNEDITRWTSLIALPWTIKLLWGPLVDLNFTKRQWVLTMQGLITAVLAVLPFFLHLPNAFTITLGTLFIAAIFSATCDIATDGFYLLALRREQQSGYVGIQSTFYRLGRLFCIGVLVTTAGLLQHGAKAGENPGLMISTWTTALLLGAATYALGWINIALNCGNPGFGRWEPTAPLEILRMILRYAALAGAAVAAWFFVPAGLLVGKHIVWWFANIGQSGQMSLPDWQIKDPVLWVRFLFGAIWGAMLIALYSGRTNLPRPELDVASEQASPGENRRNLQRTLLIVALAVSGYFTLNSVVRLLAFGFWKVADDVPRHNGQPMYDLHGWALTTGQVAQELIQLPLCLLSFFLILRFLRRVMRGTQMAEAFGSFVRQPGIAAILSFILFYRFGEAMVVKMAPLFLKDAVDKGGLAIPNEVLGQINGVMGVLGIVIGGILGGVIVSRFGLRKSFWPIVLCMHLPNLLYVWASRVHPPLTAIYGVVFVDQFGYGFGFAGYQVYLMYVAQRGNFRTAHYAIGTGLGALCIMIAGIVSGIVQANLGYQSFFLFVVFATIPGMLTLLFIPLQERNREEAVVTSQ
jgi:hypothetical protein